MFRESKERNGPVPVGTMLSVSEYHGVTPKDYDHEEQRRTDAELETYRVVRPGQLAVNSMWLNHLGLGVSDHLGHISPAYAAFDISERIDRRFAHHLLRSQLYLKIYLRYLYGIRPNSYQIKTNDWNSIPIIVPPVDTQKAIAAFLDRETARIDQLIEKKQRLVALLGETRSNITTEVLYPLFGRITWSVEDKAFRFIPQHSGGRVVRLKYLVQHMTSGARGWSDEVGDEGELFLQSGNIGRRMQVDFSSAVRVKPQSGAEANRTAVRAQDVLVCITGGRTGAVGFVETEPERSYINQHVCLLRSNPQKILPRLLAQLLWSQIGQSQFSACQYGLKQGLGFSEVANILLPIPPFEQQAALTQNILERCQRVDQIERMTALSITRLQEHRSALITAAVTGQIDVTRWSRYGEADRRLDQIQEELAG